jgi:choline dehydrogenase
MEIKSSDPLEYPAIHPNYLSDERDHRVAVGGVKVARRIASTAIPSTMPPAPAKWDIKKRWI